MIRVKNLLLLFCFFLAMGCGENSSGESQPQSASQPAPPAQERVAALSDDDGSRQLADVASVNYQEGTHYERLPKPVPTVDPDRIEVTEVFWYGCGHCFDFEPLIEEWSADVADDVVVVKSPAMWDKQGIMEKHARIYYTARALDVLDKISPAAFRALNVERNPLRTDDAIAELFVENGVSREAFERTFNSFGVTSEVRKAEARQRAYQVKGTPEVIVDGTYRISTRMAGSHEAVLKVADFLIEKIRQQKTTGQS